MGQMASAVKGQLIAKGRTAEVYAWQDNQVLKLFYDWCPADWIRREVKIGRRLSTTSLPTPKLLDSVSVDGRQGIIYERVEGRSMLRLLTTKPWLVTRLARQFAELHSAIHTHSGDSFVPLRPWLEASITQTESLPPQIKREVLNLLGHFPDGAALCHLDFHPDQVMITPRGLMILDWMTACQGDPLADVARTSVLLTFGQAPYMNRLIRNLIDLLRGAFYRSYLSRYLALHPQVTRAEVEAWMIPVAAARLREDIPGEQQPILEFIRRSLQEKKAEVA
jgi:aminoglycoside phosphotransferase (APT) family kinase protein